MWLNKGDVSMPPGSLHWKLTERKILAALRTQNPHQYCTWLFCQTMYQPSYPRSFGTLANRTSVLADHYFQSQQDKCVGWPLFSEPTGQVCWLTIVFRANRTSVLADQHCFRAKCVGWPLFSEPTGQVCWLTIVFRANRASVLADHCFQSQQGKCVGWPTLFSEPTGQVCWLTNTVFSPTLWGSTDRQTQTDGTHFPSTKDMVQPQYQTQKKRFL